ncbi:MAG: TonB-dependent siderophore receptor [Novosphingobium sp.]|nr:TonB-dependent siderophore receptor [Novosphingobium sp.]
MSIFNTLSRALFGGAAVVSPGPALATEADTDAPDPIVVTGERQGYAVDDGSSATKTPTAWIDTPQTITALSRDQLDDQAVQQLGDALRYVPGVVLGQGEGHRDQVTLRGQNTTADFFLDGLRDDTQYYRPLYNIDRVEVLKGANAMIFGRGGGGGVINRVSKVAGVDAGFVHGAASADSFGAFDIAADLNQTFGGSLGGRLNAIYQELDNHRQVFDGRFIGISPTLTAGLGERTTLTLGYTYDDDKRVTDRGVPALAGRPIRGFRDTFFGQEGFNRSRVKAHHLRGRLDAELSDSLSANATALFTDSDKFYANVYARGATATTAELEGYADGTERQNWIGQANLVWTGATGPIGHTLLIGGELTDQDSDNDRRNVLFAGGTNGGLRVTVPLAERIVVPAVSLTPIIRDSRSRLSVRSAYVQDQIALGEHLEVVAGVRYDDFEIRTLNLINNFRAERSDGKWSPRVGVIGKPQPNLSLYASYAKSFLPQAGDQFLVLDATTETLAPEVFENLEAGVKWEPMDGLTVSAAVFQLDRDNTRATDPLTGFAVQTGKTRTKGFEAHLAGQITPQWQASLGYANQDGEVRSTTTAAPAGRELAQVPRHQVTAWTRYDFTPALGLGLGFVHQSKSFATISNAVTLPSFTRVDAAAFWTVNPRIAVQLNVENLFDERYFPSAHTDHNISTGEPLNARIGVRVKL